MDSDVWQDCSQTVYAGWSDRCSAEIEQTQCPVVFQYFQPGVADPSPAQIKLLQSLDPTEVPQPLVRHSGTDDLETFKRTNL